MAAILRAACLRLDEPLSAILDAGADLDFVGAYGDEPHSLGEAACFLAASGGHALCLGVLIAAGARFDVPDSIGSTPLRLAAHSGHASCVELLLTAGANPSGHPGPWTSPLEEAFSWGRIDCAEALVRGGADVDKPNGDGRSFALRAAHAGWLPMLEI